MCTGRPTPRQRAVRGELGGIWASLLPHVCSVILWKCCRNVRPLMEYLHTNDGTRLWSMRAVSMCAAAADYTTFGPKDKSSGETRSQNIWSCWREKSIMFLLSEGHNMGNKKSLEDINEWSRREAVSAMCRLRWSQNIKKKKKRFHIKSAPLRFQKFPSVWLRSISFIISCSVFNFGSQFFQCGGTRAHRVPV